MGSEEYFLAIRDTIALIGDISSLHIKGFMASKYGIGAHNMYLGFLEFMGRSPPVQ